MFNPDTFQQFVTLTQLQLGVFATARQSHSDTEDRNLAEAANQIAALRNGLFQALNDVVYPLQVVNFNPEPGAVNYMPGEVVVKSFAEENN